MLDVLQRASTKALVSMERFRAKLAQAGLPADSSIDDDALDAIVGVSDEVAGANGIRRPPWRQLYRETWQSDTPAPGGCIRRYLSRWPAFLVSLTVDGDAVDLETVRLDESRREELVFEAPYRVRQVVAEYWGGWILPPQLVTWSAAQTVKAGKWVEAEGYTFEATTGGATGATEPAWPSAPADGDEIADGQVIWTATAAEVLPMNLRVAALAAALDWYHGALEAPAHIASEAEGGGRRTYRQNAGPFAPSVQRILEGYR